MIEPISNRRPYVVSWNLTYRCNQACVHCYLDADAGSSAPQPEFDRTELDTASCLELMDQLAELAPEAMVILTGGEPLLRPDLLELIEYGSKKGLWIVIGTTGFRLTAPTVGRLAEAGLRGVALSLESTDPEIHDRFRQIQGAWRGAVEGAAVLLEAGMPFTLGTTVGRHNVEEIEAIAQFAVEELQAPIWNLFFLVPSGRGAYVNELTSEQYARLLERLSGIQRRYEGRMTVSAKCAPHYVKTLYGEDPDSPFIKGFADSGGCPAGVQYLGIRPNGDVTPCPYLPKFGGNATREGLKAIWEDSALFREIRGRDALGGRCGPCEFNKLCGGCRARAYGDGVGLMGEDRLCDHQPGRWTQEEIAQVLPNGLYGLDDRASIVWTTEAEARIAKVPAFVRGKVRKSVEAWCRENGKSQADAQALDAVRASMPAGPAAMFRNMRRANGADSTKA